MAMADSTLITEPPRKLLLATDLSARCDRALDRAVSLALHWQAQLTVLHVFEETLDPTAVRDERSKPSWRRSPDTIAIAKRRIHHGLRSDLGDALDAATVLIEEGEPADIIQSIASREASDLIITGIARERPFARHPVTMGKTVEQLLRRSQTPVLIVRNRPRGSYQHILLATDMSDSSARALQVALHFFPMQQLQLLHAFDLPYTSLVPDPAHFDKGMSEELTKELESFLVTSGLSMQDRSRLDLLVERGRPGTLIRAYANDRHADLVVLGTQGRSAMLEALIGSTAKSILSAMPCDALIVRALRD
jgi:nucleotide-binding universal stress UspA family protein